MLASDIDHALHQLGAHLERAGQSGEIVVLGGASLLARELTSRATQDVDVLGIRLPDGSVRSAHPLPEHLRRAADEVGLALDLNPDWLDDRPGSDFTNAAPDGFEQRLELVRYSALSVWHLAASDILTIKLIASAERWGERPNKHWNDARELGADAAALAAARAFASRVWSDSSAAWTCLDEMERVLDDD